MDVMPLFALLCLGIGALRRVAVYDAFLEGAREGLSTAGRILPALIAMLCAIRAFTACGLMDGLCGALTPLLGDVDSFVKGMTPDQMCDLILGEADGK